jgi:hypothetical protein
MFVLQSKAALVVTKTGREVKRNGNLAKKKAQNKSEVKNPNCTATNPLFVLFGTHTAINLKIRVIPIH